MTGNLWEWCNDWYDKNYYKHSPLGSPLGADTAMYKVARGGAWFNEPIHCRVANRSYYKLTEYGRYLGFRLAGSP